ncbi:MAG: permease-like cell division protein FtsX, partial [Flavobacteriaceae bacterium]|nr:permease-like cell division protein FtsX [Flavobacteriaceae bacterium]
RSKVVSDHFKEQVAITIFLKDNTSKKTIESLQKQLEKDPFVKSIQYTSKEEAAKRYSEDIGEDFMEYLGTNPLKNAIDVYVKSEYVTPEKMTEIETKLSKNKAVFEISYDKSLIELLTKNLKRIGLWVLVFSAVFALIAIVLINSAIRLSVYSKRFTIKTMQMVGATKGFIRGPFIWQGVKLGIIGALVAIVGIMAVILYLHKNIPEILLLDDKKTLGIIFGLVLLSGVVITAISTFLATQRFLNLRTEDLYY